MFFLKTYHGLSNAEFFAPIPKPFLCPTVKYICPSCTPISCPSTVIILPFLDFKNFPTKSLYFLSPIKQIPVLSFFSKVINEFFSAIFLTSFLLISPNGNSRFFIILLSSW